MTLVFCKLRPSFSLSRHSAGSSRNCRALEAWVGRAEVLFEMRGVVQLVRTPACHAGGRGFESRRSRQHFKPRMKALLNEQGSLSESASYRSLTISPAYRLRYSSSLTFSIQVTALPLSSSVMAVCVIEVVGAAPCQCFVPAGIQTTSPFRISSTGPPHC